MTGIAWPHPMILQHVTGLRWVIATGMPWMTAANAFDALNSTTHRTAFLHGKYEVLTAGRVESAVPSQPGADGQLINANAQNQNGSRGGRYSLDQLSESLWQETLLGP